MAKLRGGKGWSFEPADSPQESAAPATSLPPDQQRLRVALEKRAKGKVVTVISGLVLTAADLKQLAKKLKAACGTGGSTTTDTVELQGDCRERATAWLQIQGWGGV